MRRRRLITSGSVLALAGCLEFSSRTEEPTGEELLADAIDSRTKTSDLAAIRTIRSETPEERVERTERISQRPPDAQRLEVIESTDPNASVGTVSVRNQHVTWDYDPDAETVFERHHPNRIVADRTRLVLESLLEESRLEYVGTEAVRGYETHVVDTTPPADAGLDRSIELLVGETVYVIPLERTGEDSTPDPEDVETVRRIWITEADRYPIKEENIVRTAETTLHDLTVTYGDLQLNAGLDDGTFTYDPPADAEFVSRGTEPAGIYASRVEATEAVPYEIPDPDVPDGFSLDRITVLEKEASTTATSWYVDRDRFERELFVAVRENTRFDEDALETVDIDGIDASVRDGQIESVFWECEELSFEVSSPHTDEPIEEVAASIGCPE